MNVKKEADDELSYLNPTLFQILSIDLLCICRPTVETHGYLFIFKIFLLTHTPTRMFTLYGKMTLFVGSIRFE